MKNFFFALFLLVAFASCKQESIAVKDITGKNQISMEDMVAFTKLASTNYDGYVGFTISNTANNTLNSNSMPRIYATFKDKASGNLIDAGSMEINSYKMTANSQNIYDNLTDVFTSEENRKTARTFWGKKVNISVGKKSGAENLTVLDANHGLPSELYGSFSSGSNFSRTGTITWNQDPNNQKGNYIFISFRPEGLNNDAFVSYPLTKKVLSVPDNGYYQFSPSDFDGIPFGAFISISCARGTYTEIKGNDGSSEYLIYAYTSISDARPID